MRRVLVVLAVLGVLFAALWWNETTERGGHAGGAVAPEGEAPARLEGGALVPVGGRELMTETLRTETPTAVRRTEGLQVEVVDAEGAPLAGADVYVLWIDAARESEFEEQGFEFEDLPDAVEEEGEQGRTDERGSSWFSLGSGELVAVVARHGSSFGMDMLDELEPAGEQPLQLRIQIFADFDVSVRVLDPLGRPAEDVPVSLRGGQMRLESTTDSDGEAEFEHVGSLSPDEHEPEWVVNVDVLTRVPVRQELGRLTRAATVVLQLPPTGSVEVSVEDADGKAIPDGSQVYLFAPEIERGKSAKIDNGVASFVHVETGLELEARAHRGFAGHAVNSGPFTGPLRPGDEVRHRIAFGVDSSVLPLRVRRPDGRLLENSLGVQILGDTGRVTRTDLRPVEDGCYRVDLAQQPDEARLRVQLDAWAGKDVGARFELALPLAFGILPEREVVLSEAPILLAGRIVDASGRPVVTIEHEDGQSDGLALEYQLPGAHITGSLRTDSEGRFVVRTFYAAEEIPVRVTRWSKGGEFVRVPPGSADLVLVLDERE